MDVIRHKAVAEDAQAVSAGFLTQHLKVDDPIAVVEENYLAVVAPLSNVVWDVRHNHARYSRQGLHIAVRAGTVKLVTCTPSVRQSNK